MTRSIVNICLRVRDASRGVARKASGATRSTPSRSTNTRLGALEAQAHLSMTLIS
jgi:hypothetical protein